MNERRRQLLAESLILAGALALFGSLFLTWSHQLPPSFLVRFGHADVLRDVPRDPTGWQVYSAADVVLALLAIGLLSVALLGHRVARIAALPVTVAGLVFALHALSSPPTNGAAGIFHPELAVPNYLPLAPSAGVGETLAIAGLLCALAGLLVPVARERGRVHALLQSLSPSRG